MDKGAHFYRCDFQVHTPRDQNWRGQDAVSTDERDAYARTLIQSCRDRDLYAIAITDHHDMAFLPYVQRAALEETDPDGNPVPAERRIVIFPGIELTLGVPCQAILLLDADFPANMFVPLLTALSLTPPPDHEARNGNVDRISHVHSFVEMKKNLDLHSWLKDKYIVFPNVSGEGQFSLLRAGQMGKYIEMPCVGGYLDGSINRLRPGSMSIINGRDRNWGNKRIACIQTSDNRHEDHRDLGKHTTWIKWATPTAEALRQACLAQESRISHDAPQLPTLVIASIAVSNSKFLGPIDLDFNSQYNALIGGRGTGKSTLLEYLRWALCDQPPNVMDEDTPNYQARRARLIEETLKPLEATVDVRFVLNGVPHVVRRSSLDGTIKLKIGSSEMRPCAEDEVRALLPIDAYSQKQLSGVSVRLDELTRFVTGPIRGELSRIDQSLADHAERIRQGYAIQRRRRTLEISCSKLELEHQSLSQQADSVRLGLTGLSEEDRALLDRGKVFEAASVTNEAWLTAVGKMHDVLSDLKDTARTSFAGLSPPPAVPKSEALHAAFLEVQQFFGNLATMVTTAIGQADAMLDSSYPRTGSNPWTEWNNEYQAFGLTYETAVRKSSSHTEKLAELRRLERLTTEAARNIGRLKEEMSSLQVFEPAYLADRTAWKELLNERDSLFEAQCTALTTNSRELIRASVRRMASADDFVSALKQAMSGSRVPSAKLESIGKAIAEPSSSNGLWAAILTELELLAEYDPEHDGAERSADAPMLKVIGLSPSDLERIGRTLKPDQWLTLSLIPITSLPVFEYRSREDEYIPFNNASAGQQATALLQTLLAQGTAPLIIDQPEEDLDNPVMIEIVRSIWKAKQRRQIIFASHNANLVVNGDAELVAWCNYRAPADQSRGTIDGAGAIDMPEAREAIKRIMEGGAAAFNLRKEKYGF
jgi:type III restriction enzyme